MLEIIGLEVTAIKGCNFINAINSKSIPFKMEQLPIKEIEPLYILFNDNETYITLKTQDFHEYHDYDNIARIIVVTKDRDGYKKILDDPLLSDANIEIT